MMDLGASPAPTAATPYANMDGGAPVLGGVQVKWATAPRWGCAAQTLAGALNGTVCIQPIWLPKGLTIGHLMFQSGSTGFVDPTHWWFGLYDNNLNQLATTADQTTAAWAANTAKALAIHTTAAGTVSSFVTTYSGMHYIGILCAFSAGGNVPNFTGPTGDLLGSGTVPIAGQETDSGQTTPPGFPHTLTGTGTRVGGVVLAAVG